MKTVEDFLRDNGFVSASELDRQALLTAFISEMEKGLKGESSSLMMIPTFVGVNGKIPEGASAAVLDAGGTNFRGAIVSIPPQISDKQNQPMPGTKGEVDEESFYNAFAASRVATVSLTTAIPSPPVRLRSSLPTYCPTIAGALMFLVQRTSSASSVGVALAG